MCKSSFARAFNRRKNEFSWNYFVAKFTWLAALLVCFLSSLAAQTNTADIVETVTDASGAVVPKATISVVNTGTGQKRTVQTNDAGEFTFSLLQVGTYSVQVESVGFKTYRVPGVTIAAGDRARVDGQLQPGEIGQVVDVVSAAPALQTDNSTTGSLVDNTQVEELPLNGRNVINLVQVQPGVTPGLGGSYGAGNKPDDQFWAKGRVALVGDAGYCPSPAAGMGGSMAILGAAALADALQKYPADLRRAFQEYDENLRPTVERIQAHAVEFGLEMFMPRSEEAIQKRNLQLRRS